MIVDTFNPLLSNLAVSFNGTAWAETTNYTYDETTGVFTTIAGQITVPAATYTQNPATGVWTAESGCQYIGCKRYDLGIFCMQNCVEQTDKSL